MVRVHSFTVGLSLRQGLEFEGRDFVRNLVCYRW